MSKTDNKQAQQNHGRFHSLATHIQHHPYISLTIPSLIFIAISVTHFLISDKTLQTIIQVIAYILGLIIVIILFVIAHNQRKADSSKIDLIFLCGISLATLLGFAYFSKMIGDISAIIIGIASIAVQITLPLYAKTGKSKESDTQENLSDPSPKFSQENSSASIQNNSPISIQNNNNSPISIQNIINTTDERSERERNTAKACEILASKDSTSRISAVKTLANIADSWLEDSPNCKKDEKKCQDIIEILCTYIKSPFDLVYRRQNLEYSQRLEDMEDQSKLLAEQTVRRTIFEVISRQIDKYCKSDDSSYPTNPRLSKIWEEVDLDFSYAHIFYSLDNLTLKNAKFNYSHFFGDANFNHSTFKGKTYFQGAKFYNDVSFEETTFEGDVDFSSADFQKPHLDQVDSLATMIKSSQKHPLAMHNADALYKHLRKERFAPPGKTVFYESKFYGAANFQCTLFYGWADFQEAEFHEDVEFLSFVYKGMQFEQTRFNYKKETDFFFLPKDRRQNMLKPQKYIEIEKLIPIESILFDPDSEKNK